MTARAQSVGSWLHSSRKCRISDSIASPMHNRDREALVRFNRLGAPRGLPSLAFFKMGLVLFYDPRSRVGRSEKSVGLKRQAEPRRPADARRPPAEPHARGLGHAPRGRLIGHLAMLLVLD